VTEGNAVPLTIVLHDLGALSPESEKRFFEAIFQIAPTHWRIAGGATLLETGVSPGYIRDYLKRVLQDEAAPDSPLLVLPAGGAPAWHALPPAGATWLEDVLAE